MQLEDKTYSFQICDTSRIGMGDLLSKCDIGKTDYRILIVASGDYTLSSFDVAKGGSRGAVSHSTTAFNGLSKGLFGQDVGLRAGKYASKANVLVHLEPGEIVYVGDLLFDPQQFPVGLSLERNDAAAQEALWKFPNVKGEMQYRSPVSSLNIKNVTKLLKSF